MRPSRAPRRARGGASASATHDKPHLWLRALEHLAVEREHAEGVDDATRDCHAEIVQLLEAIEEGGIVPHLDVVTTLAALALPLSVEGLLLRHLGRRGDHQEPRGDGRAAPRD